MTRNSLTRTLAPLVALGLSAPCFAQASLDNYVFSLDIGSDTEISDPFAGAGELADPGDVYQSSSVAGSLAGAPFLDDLNLFGGVDPAPQQGVVASAVPVGNPAALYLATAGAGTLILNDFDTVDETNLPRQPLFTAADIGAGKAATAREALLRLNPDVNVEAIDERLAADGLAEQVARADVVIDGTDNFSTRFAVNTACVAGRVPLVSGAAIRFEAQLGVFRADLPQQACYRCLYDDNAETIGDCQGQGVLTPLVGVIGAAMALEAARIVVGFGDSQAGALLLCDALSGQWRRVTLHRDPACPVCADTP